MQRSHDARSLQLVQFARHDDGIRRIYMRPGADLAIACSDSFEAGPDERLARQALLTDTERRFCRC